MDVDARRQELINEQAALEGYFQHPVTREVLSNLHETEKGLVSTICDVPVHDIESFFKHFEAVGHLRGIRQTKALLKTSLEEVKEALKEL